MLDNGVIGGQLWAEQASAFTGNFSPAQKLDDNWPG